MKCLAGGAIARCLFALVLLAACAQVSVAQGRWQKFSGPDQDFTVEFPSAPIHTSHPNNLEGSPIEDYTIISGDHSFGITYQDAPEPVDGTSRESLRALAEGCRLDANSTGRKLLRVRRLPGGVVECFSSGPSGNSVHRTDQRLERNFVRGRRYYTLSVISWAKAGVNRAAAARFFSSFRLTTAQGSRGDSTGRVR
jgi:hypothetical protein